jgi:segregation and condensation protein B
MYGCCGSTGWRLRSVALRHWQPICAVGGVRPGCTGTCQVLFRGKRDFGRSLTGSGGLLRAAADRLPASLGPTARSDGLARLEAVLFLARQAQASRKLAQLAGLADGTEARTLVRKLNRLYDTEGSAFRVEEVAGGFQLMSRSKFARWLRRLHSQPVEIRLSAPAMETLAVVAYRQPVLRAEIEAIRGVQCGEILRQLIERDLVRIVGRSEELGRPLLYGTTRQFLQVFGLRHLDELPRRELLQVAQLRPAGTAMADGAEIDRESPHQPNYSHELEEETEVKTAVTANTHHEDLSDEDAAHVAQTTRSEQSDEEYEFEDYAEEEDESDDEDEEEDEEEYDEEEEQYDEVEEEEEEEDEEDEDEEEEEEEEEEDLEEEAEWEEVEDDDEEEDEDWEDEDEEEDWEDDDWEEEDEEDEDKEEK